MTDNDPGALALFAALQRRYSAVAGDAASARRVSRRVSSRYAEPPDQFAIVTVRVVETEVPLYVTVSLSV